MDNLIVISKNTNLLLEVTKSLQYCQFHIVHAASKQEALARCEEEGIALAIVEKELGEDDGIEVFQLLVQQWPFMRGILISQHLGIGLLTKIVESRFDDCLSIPIQKDLLYESVMHSMRSLLRWRVRFREYRHHERLPQHALTDKALLLST